MDEYFEWISSFLEHLDKLNVRSIFTAKGKRQTREAILLVLSCLMTCLMRGVPPNIIPLEETRHEGHRGGNPVGAQAPVVTNIGSGG